MSQISVLRVVTAGGEAQVVMVAARRDQRTLAQVRCHGVGGVAEQHGPAAMQLPGLTRGEGVLDCAFHRYQVVPGRGPVRPRSGPSPAEPEGVPAVRPAPGGRTARVI